MKIDIELDESSWFYKNCKKQRASKAQICQSCPLKAAIEVEETFKELDTPEWHEAFEYLAEN